MGTRGLPALSRAVPVHLFGRLFSVFGRQGGGRRGMLAHLIRDLPPDLLAQALTHSSRATTRLESNERLEFLGDSVLGLAVAAEVFLRYPNGEEGELARLKAFVVSRKSCAEAAERLGVGRLMAERASESRSRRSGATYGETTVGNALEALIGAVYLHFGFEKARIGIVEAFEEQFHYGVTAHVDYKTALQEMVAPRGLQPEYRLVGEDGPAHARVFSSEVRVAGVVRGRGTGTTIKMSEQAAAKEALTGLHAETGSA
jgi:ribonuclease-3